MAPRYLGEFEQMVLLATLQLRDEAYAISIIKELEVRVGRSVGRGTLYKTLERLETKGFLQWKAEAGSPERGGHARRRFRVTSRGVAALRESRDAFQKLTEGLDEVLEGPA